MSLSTAILDLVHMDIWGSTSVSLNGSRFFFTIVDGYSRFTWVVALKSKHEVAEIVPKFSTMVKKTSLVSASKSLEQIMVLNSIF